ncbi:MAG: hypothetical protein PHV60_06595 [bacterium]|nr:hypothetical protein [bacterium]
MKIEDIFNSFVMMAIGVLIGMWGYLFPLELKFNPGMKEKDYFIGIRGMAIVLLFPLITGYKASLLYVPFAVLLWVYARRITDFNYLDNYKHQRLIAGKYTFLGIAIFSICYYYFQHNN